MSTPQPRAPSVQQTSAPYTAIPFPPDDGIDLTLVPKEFKKEGSDWHALYNPEVPRKFEITLLHTLSHLTYVSALVYRASADV